MFENWGLGERAFEVTLACLGALLPAIMTTRLLISTLRTLERGGDLLRAARRGATPLLGVACPTLILSMLVTPSLNKAAETELVYQVRDGALKLWPLFVVRWMWTVGWLALAAGYLVGLGVWWHRMRTWASATRW
ncbi:MAG: hypothetical protein JNL79_32270 [Myxococcales bacterium]|nr:hypothetical protein [Myxococcales bacterium]